MCEIKDFIKQPPIIWDSQIVITTARLAEVYGTTTDNINNNFGRNKERFTAGKHFILLEGEELREFKNCSSFSWVVGKTTRQLYLWTRRGASRHCKILGTDKAWEQFDYLEENYFDRKPRIDRRQLSPDTQALLGLIECMARTELEQKRQAEQLNRLEQTQETIVQTFSKESTKDFRPWVKQCITAISESPTYHFAGTKPEKYQAVTKESYDRLNQKKPCRLKQRVESEKGRALSAGASAARVNSINKLTIIENDKALKPIYETVLKEMMIAYCTYERKEV